jgi:hypothetical protein
MVFCNLGEGHYPQAGAGDFLATYNCAALVNNGAGDFSEGHRATGIAHCYNGEEGL